MIIVHFYLKHRIFVHIQSNMVHCFIITIVLWIQICMKCLFFIRVNIRNRYWMCLFFLLNTNIWVVSGSIFYSVKVKLYFFLKKNYKYCLEAGLLNFSFHRIILFFVIIWFSSVTREKASDLTCTFDRSKSFFFFLF